MSRPSERDVKRLFALAGNRCAFPKCACAIAEGTSLIGEICHIRADKPRGPRYDPSQSEPERQGFDNLILLCANHHKVVDDDEDSYTVERLTRMKRDHESHSIPLNDSPENNAVVSLLINQSVSTVGQTGGIAAHVVNADTIHVHSANSETVRGARTTKALEALWNIIVSFRKEFNDIILFDSILLKGEIAVCFAGQDTNPFFASIYPYRDKLYVAEKMQRLLPEDTQTHRLFVSARIWALYEALFALYGRSAMLITLSFKDRRLHDWREDGPLDQFLRSVLPSAIIDAEKQRPNAGLNGLISYLENAFLQDANKAQ